MNTKALTARNHCLSTISPALQEPFPVAFLRPFRHLGEGVTNFYSLGTDNDEHLFTLRETVTDMGVLCSAASTLGRNPIC